MSFTYKQLNTVANTEGDQIGKGFKRFILQSNQLYEEIKDN